MRLSDLRTIWQFYRNYKKIRKISNKMEHDQELTDFMMKATAAITESAQFQRLLKELDVQRQDTR